MGRFSDARREEAQPVVPSYSKDISSGLQDDAGTVQEPAASLSLAKKFDVSVEEVLTRLAAVNIAKSKDTIQRYCREGRLDCQKIGVFRRYYATEESVAKLIEWLQIDADVDGGVQVHEDASSDFVDEMHPHADAPSDIAKENKDTDAGASSRSQLDTAASPIVEMLKQQIADKDEDIAFLREELRERRSAVNALEKLVGAFEKNAETSRLNAANEERRMKEVVRVRDYEPAAEQGSEHSSADPARDAEPVENATKEHPLP